MKKGYPSKINRRHFARSAAALAGGLLLGGPALRGAPAIIKNYRRPASVINGVHIGVITYSFRSLEDQSAEATLQYILDSGISATELMGDPAETFAGKPAGSVDRRAMFRLSRARRDGELTEEQEKELAELRAQMDAYGREVSEWRKNVPMERFEQLGKMYKDAGVQIYGFKPSTFGKDSPDSDIDYGMRAARALGASHVTLEHPADDAHTARLGKFAKKHKVYVAYHGHEQQTPTFWDTALEQSKYNAMNADIGHYVAAGYNPLDLLRAKHDRIMSIHVKDRQTPEHGKGNLPWGTGDTPITEALQLMRDEKYSFPATIELEYDIPEGSDPIAEVRKCLDYCRQSLS